MTEGKNRYCITDKHVLEEIAIVDFLFGKLEECDAMGGYWFGQVV